LSKVLHVYLGEREREREGEGEGERERERGVKKSIVAKPLLRLQHTPP